MTDLIGLFPPAISVLMEQVDDCQGPLHPSELQYIEGAVAKRRREFTAGRVLARRILLDWGIVSGEILCDDNRAPLWPAGIVGSITHTDKWCLVALGRSPSTIGVGVDMEEIGRVTPPIWPKILLPSEVDWIMELPVNERDRWSAIVFSAKEAFYKYQYPQTKRWLGFTDVEIIADDSQQLTVIVDNAQAASGRFLEFDEHVITGFCSPI